MRGIVGLIVTLVIAALVGVGAYQLGVSQGLASTGTAVAPVAYYHPFFWGFGFFGFLFPLLFIFLIFGLLRAAFWGGGWGRRYGYGGYWGDRAARLEDWHKRAHGESTASTDAGGTGGSNPPTGR